MSVGAFLPDPARFVVFTLGVGVGLLVLAAYLVCRASMKLSRFIGLSLVLAGGMSNVLDRLLRDGLVTDFITVRIGPLHTGVFNAADMLIMTGVATIVLSTSQKRTPPTGPTGNSGSREVSL